MRLVDYDVIIIIWNRRGRDAAAELLGAEPFAISAVTYMELVQRMRNSRELRELRSDLKLWKATIVPITDTISDRATALVEAHFLSHHLQLADTLIAATAIAHQLPRVTSNLQHFRVVKRLELQPFRAP